MLQPSDLDGMLERMMRVLIAIVCLGWVAGPSSTAWAADECGGILFSCRSPESDVTHGISLNELRHRRVSVAFVDKYCYTMDTKNCGSWRAFLRGQSGSGGSGGSPSGSRTTVVSDVPPSDKPPVARDAKGKLGPTPAPMTAEPVPNDVVPGDEPFALDLTAAAQRYKLPVHLLRAVMKVESGGNPLAVSPKGAIGLMQLMPETAKHLGVDDPHDTHQNIMGGARFLRILANRFDGDLVKVLSSYHAGAFKVQGRDATPYAATDDYVRKILRLYYQLRDASARTR